LAVRRGASEGEEHQLQLDAESAAGGNGRVFFTALKVFHPDARQFLSSGLRLRRHTAPSLDRPLWAACLRVRGGMRRGRLPRRSPDGRFAKRPVQRAGVLKITLHQGLKAQPTTSGRRWQKRRCSGGGASGCFLWVAVFYRLDASLLASLLGFGNVPQGKVVMPPCYLCETGFPNRPVTQKVCCLPFLSIYFFRQVVQQAVCVCRACVNVCAWCGGRGEREGGGEAEKSLKKTGGAGQRKTS
jgi:hypothetical protein